jgi:hypothetical protein
MKKLMFSMLSLACMLAISSGGQTPSASAAPPSAPEIGGCRWFCGNSPTPFRTAAACDAACSSDCEVIC